MLVKITGGIRIDVSTGATGATGATGPTGPALNIMAEIQGAGSQTIPANTSQFIDFTGNTKVGDGSILVNGTDIIVPETGTYMVCYAISGGMNSSSPTAGISVSVNLRQRNVSGTFNQVVLGSFIASNFVGSTTALTNDDGLTNCSLVCVADTGGGALNNIIRLQTSVDAVTGGATAWIVEGVQTSITVTKYSDDICSPY
ncbi:hypothetical protein OIN60_20530 [Paenibacillus sp. P96]|uniref:Collagen-like protein n=1 Tax=Paenibacillus zeirhizosphaerae TaxID=2987519 RepID=A0ABT9FWK5_9BACL|nr:hypothetical protein [Paenibacillus sp. P96]MDP4099111.1 hypothetical protein [Paenibacillus sp. P96]